MKRALVLIAVCGAAFVSPLKANIIDWTGGAGTENFGDPLNWSQDPEFTGVDPVTSTNTHQIAIAALVTTGDANYEYPWTRLSHPDAVFTVGVEGSVTNFGGQWVAGEMNIQGRLDAGGGVIGSGVTQEDLVVNVQAGGFFRGVGNNSFAGNVNHNRNVEINVWGEMLLKLNMMTQWATASTNNNFLIRVYPGGVYRVNQAGVGNINMRCDEDSTARIELWGGFLNVGAANQYNFSNVTNAPGNGIVFRDSASSISVTGSNVVAVQEWMDAGALFTEVPGSVMEATYHASSNVTVVTLSVDVDPVFTSLDLDGGNAFLSFGMASGTAYRVEASANLLDEDGWVDLTGWLTNQAGGAVTFTDTNTAAYPVRSYRLSSP